MADRVVQVARDPRSLLGGGEAATALDPLAVQANAVACDQRQRPDEEAEQERHRREGAVADADRRDVRGEQRTDECDRPTGCAGARRGEEEECDRGADRWPRRVVEQVERRTRERRHDEDRKRPAPPERER